jgi:pimeloyl-ACP methyl ester carboxylesterase
VPNILIYGIRTLLGSHCAARWLQLPNAGIWYLTSAGAREEVIDLIAHAASQMPVGAVTTPAQIAERVHPAGAELDVDALGRIAAAGVKEAWCFVSSRNSAKEAEAIERLTSACPAIGVQEINYVEFDHDLRDGSSRSGQPEANDARKSISDSRISQQCRLQNIKHRVFRTSLIVGEEHSTQDQNAAVLSRFLGALHAFKAEIEERSAQYFDFQALRFLAPADGTINLLPAGVAAELLLRVARNPKSADNSFVVASPEGTSFSGLCERIGIAYGLGLLAAEEPRELNAIDRAFHERAGELKDCIACGPDAPAQEAYLAAGISPETGVFDDEAQMEALESIRRRQDEVRAARDQRVAAMPATLEKKTVIIDGEELAYHARGTTGPAVVLLNALGQGLEFWYRLIDRLGETHRVIIWEPRGTVSPAPPFGLAAQVDDLGAVLQNEHIETCHLVGWCTGPKVAIDFYLRSPTAVRSMAFLNSTFKCDGSAEELDTPYEKNLEFLCRRLARKPAMATAMMKTFQAAAGETEMDFLEGADSEEISVKVLSMANANLKSGALAPFRSEATTLNYARQLVDFWANDIRPKASQVQAPVLLMSSEYDEIVTPATSRMAAGLFPDARHVHVAGATHYCFYERPELVADLLSTFFRNPNHIPVLERAEDAVAL